MRIFDLFKMSPSLHSKCVFLYGYEYTYCQTCAKRDSRVCHRLCKWHDKPYWQIRKIQEEIDESVISRKGKQMNKYKVGDKFILEIQNVGANKYPYETELDYYRESELDKLPMLVNGVDTYSYNKGAEDAWELMKLINANYDKGGLKLTELREIFGTHNINNIFVENTYQEAKAKFDAWKKVKEEIMVGDLVYVTNAKRGNGIVSRIDRDWCTVIWVDGSSGKWHINELAKTGESHADEVAALTGLLK